MKKELQTITPDACAFCQFRGVGFTAQDAKRDGWNWEKRPTVCTCAPALKLRAVAHQHIYNEVHFQLSRRQYKRLLPGVTYRWGSYGAVVRASTTAHC